MFVRSEAGLWKVCFVILLASASSALANYNSEQFSNESPILFQINHYTNLTPAQEQQSTYIDTGLMAAAKEFFSPPASFVQFGNKLEAGVRALPAIPETIFMALFGFLCVFFVKDRRVCLAALAGLLWAGQTGFTIVPKLVLSLTGKNYSHRQPSQLSSKLYLKNSSEFWCNNKETQYIGLLRHLDGIPALKDAFKGLYPKVIGTKNVYNFDTNPNWFEAVIPSQTSDFLLRCLVKRTDHILYFSPAFLFDNLARGPPVE